MKYEEFKLAREDYEYILMRFPCKLQIQSECSLLSVKMVIKMLLKIEYSHQLLKHHTHAPFSSRGWTKTKNEIKQKVVHA